MNTKPKLVDYNLFYKPTKNIIKKIPIITKNDNSILINLIGILILFIGGICIYQRYSEKETKEIEKKNLILGFYGYVKENIK